MRPLKIAQRGILLVVIPLVLELLFISVLAWMLLDASNQIWEERRARQVVTTLSLLSRQTQTAARILAAYTDSRDPKLVAQYDEVIKLAPEEFKELKQLLKDRPDDLKSLAKLEVSVMGAIDILEKCKGTFGHDEEASYAHMVYYPRLIRMGIAAERQFDVLLKRYRAKEMADRAVYDRSVASITFWLCVTVLSNLAGALIVAMSFYRQITARLNVLIDNTIRLASRKPLNERVSGSDEIAQLDKTFHQMADALSEADRLKQEFVAMISHDLRTPLTAVQGTLELLSDGTYGELKEVGLKRVRTAESETDRLIQLINNLLDIEKLEADQLELDLEPVPLAPLVEAAVESLRPLCEPRSIVLETELAEATVHADSDRLTQVLVNLLSNAVKFSEDGGKIETSIRLLEHEAEVRVKDHGRGIPAAVGNTIFERWKQTSKKDGKTGKGSGLGLAISKSIVEAHNGTIGFNSTEGEGTTFWFRIPLF